MRKIISRVLIEKVERNERRLLPFPYRRAAERSCFGADGGRDLGLGKVSLVVIPFRDSWLPSARPDSSEISRPTFTPM